MRKLIARWELSSEELILPEDVRYSLLRAMLEEEDASWGMTRSEEAMETHLDYLMGVDGQPPQGQEDATDR